MSGLIKYFKLDIVTEFYINTRIKAICHCVNAQGKMGAGVAKDIRDNIPGVYSQYKKYISDNISNDDTSSLLGHANLVQYREEGRYIVNLFGQDRYGRENRMVNYGALSESLISARNQLITLGLTKKEFIGFPYKLACNNAGGDWSVVKELIEFVFREYNVAYFKKY